MQYINYAIVLMQVLIVAGTAVRIGIILFSVASGNENESQNYKKRIRNTIMFFIVAQGAIIIRNIIIGYF